MSIIGAALRGFGKALGKKTGKSTSKFVKRRITVGGTPLNTKEKTVLGIFPFVGKKTGKSTSKFVKRRITVGGTPLNTKEKTVLGVSGALATAGAAATGYGYKKAYNKLKEIKEKKSK